MLSTVHDPCSITVFEFVVWLPMFIVPHIFR